MDCTHWVHSKRHRLWFSKKTCSCYSTKSSNWIWLCWETYILKCVWYSMKTTFNAYVSQRSQIQFEDEDHAVYKFSLSNNYMSSLRTTTCDALIVPSGNVLTCTSAPRRRRTYWTWSCSDHSWSRGLPWWPQHVHLLHHR